MIRFGGEAGHDRVQRVLDAEAAADSIELGRDAPQVRALPQGPVTRAFAKHKKEYVCYHLDRICFTLEFPAFMLVNCTVAVSCSNSRFTCNASSSLATKGAAKLRIIPSNLISLQQKFLHGQCHVADASFCCRDIDLAQKSNLQAKYLVRLF
jgi:hypothetical protein